MNIQVFSENTIYLGISLLEVRTISSSKADQMLHTGSKLGQLQSSFTSDSHVQGLPLWLAFYSHPPTACLIAPWEQCLLFLPEQRETCWAKRICKLTSSGKFCAHENVWLGNFLSMVSFSFNNNVFSSISSNLWMFFFFSNRNFLFFYFAVSLFDWPINQKVLKLWRFPPNIKVFTPNIDPILAHLYRFQEDKCVVCYWKHVGNTLGTTKANTITLPQKTKPRPNGCMLPHFIGHEKCFFGLNVFFCHFWPRHELCVCTL